METKTNILQPFTASELAEAIPQKPPFRFVDKILFVNDTSIEGTYTFKPTEFFYPGHFPGYPLTPGVILIESMAQVGLVAFGLYLLSKEFVRADMKKLTTLFTDATVEFLSTVKPDETIHIHAKRKMWRWKKLRTNVEARTPDNSLICVAEIAGLGMPLI